MKQIELPKAIKALEIATKNLVKSRFVGNYRSVFRGGGLEFNGYREYNQDEDARLIDWKASNRINKLVVKDMIEERDLNVIFLFDVSQGMIFGSNKLKIEYGIELIASLSYAVLNANDRVGLALFNENIIKFIPPKRTKGQFFVISKTLLDNQTYGGSYNLNNALKFLLQHVKENSILIIVSDFINMKDDWQHMLKVIARKCDTIGIMIRDKLDKELPENYKVVIEDPYSSNQMLIDTNKIKDNYYKITNENERLIRKTFLSANADFLQLRTDQDFIKELIKFFGRRQKRWR